MKTNWPVTYRERGGKREQESLFARHLREMRQYFRKLQENGQWPFGPGDPMAQLAEAATFAADSSPQEVGVWVPGDLADRLLKIGHPGQIALWAAFGKAVVQGPKIFRPTAEQCEPLEQVDLTLDADDYHLPFPTCIVEFPADYSKNRIVHSSSSNNQPGLLIVTQQDGLIYTCLYLPNTTGSVDKHKIFTIVIGSDTLEECLSAAAEEVPSTSAVLPAFRAALNYLLLSATSGMRAVPQPRSDKEKHLREQLKRAKHNGREDLVEKLKQRLAKLPTIYELAQHVCLYRRDTTPSETHEGDGTPRRPCWVRGHWHTVCYGPRHSLRKLMFYEPHLRNAHLLPD